MLKEIATGEDLIMNNCFHQSTTLRARPLIFYFLDLNILTLPFCLSSLILNRSCRNIFPSFEVHELKV